MELYNAPERIHHAVLISLGISTYNYNINYGSLIEGITATDACNSFIRCIILFTLLTRLNKNMRKAFFLLFACCTAIPSLCQINEGSFYYGPARSNIINNILNLNRDSTLMKYRYDTNVYVVKTITAELGIKNESITFDIDISKILNPLYYTYSVYKESELCDTVLYELRAFDPFNESYDGIGPVYTVSQEWCKIMRAINNKKWNKDKIIIFSIQNVPLPENTDYYIFLYNDKSYFYSKGQFIDAMDYIKRHFTLPAYKKLIGDIIIK